MSCSTETPLTGAGRMGIVDLAIMPISRGAALRAGPARLA
jgi:hypothetical protein